MLAPPMVGRQSDQAATPGPSPTLAAGGPAPGGAVDRVRGARQSGAGDGLDHPRLDGDRALQQALVLGA
jgi:hypothetical protein